MTSVPIIFFLPWFASLSRTKWESMELAGFRHSDCVWLHLSVLPEVWDGGGKCGRGWPHYFKKSPHDNSSKTGYFGHIGFSAESYRRMVKQDHWQNSICVYLVQYAWLFRAGTLLAILGDKGGPSPYLTKVTPAVPITHKLCQYPSSALLYSSV